MNEQIPEPTEEQIAEARAYIHNQALQITNAMLLLVKGLHPDAVKAASAALTAHIIHTTDREQRDAVWKLYQNMVATNLRQFAQAEANPSEAIN